MNCLPGFGRDPDSFLIPKRIFGKARKSAVSRVLFFFCVPKRRNKKKAPQPVLALRASLTSRRGRDAKKLGGVYTPLRGALRQFLRLFPPPSARRGRTNGERGKFPLARRRAPERLPKREVALFERSEFATSRQHRGAQGIPPTGAQVAGCLFFFVLFLWASKEKEQKKEAYFLTKVFSCQTLYLTA